MPCGTWDLPGSGTELESSALEGVFFTTEPQEALYQVFFLFFFWSIASASVKILVGYK